MMNLHDLRIAVASSGLGHVSRGIESWADDLGKSLVERGMDALLCKGSGRANSDFERVIPCWTRDSRPTKRLLACLPNAIGWRMGVGAPYGVEQTTFAWNLIRLLRRERIDVLHLQDPQVAILTQRALKLGWIDTRTVLNHGTEEPAEFQQRITYLQHGAPWHQQQAEADGIWKPTWAMIPNFVDTQQFHPGESPALRRELSIPSDAHVLLISAAIKRRHKRIDYLIDEVHRVRQQRPDLPVWLVIAGGQEEDTDLLIRKANEALGVQVRFAVGFPRSRMPELYRMADLLIHGSLKEMMPMALLEATASGLPCLVHQHPVMQWMIGPGGEALDLRVEGALAGAIVELLDHPKRCRELGQHAREHCVQHFSQDIVIDQILHYYQRIIDSNQCRSIAAA